MRIPVGKDESEGWNIWCEDGAHCDGRTSSAGRFCLQVSCCVCWAFTVALPRPPTFFACRTVNIGEIAQQAHKKAVPR